MNKFIFWTCIFHFFSSHNAEKRGTLWNFPTSILSQNSENIEGRPLWVKNVSKKSLAMLKKTKRADPFVSSGIVCYAGNLFGSVLWANRGIKNFVVLLVELFWSLQVYRKRKKTLTKNHDYSRLFSGKALTKNQAWCVTNVGNMFGVFLTIK